jgi:hypothetical protein
MTCASNIHISASYVCETAVMLFLTARPEAAAGNLVIMTFINKNNHRGSWYTEELCGCGC